MGPAWFLGLVLASAAAASCHSSSAAHGSATTTTTTVPAADVVTEIATYRQRGTAASDHIFDPCHQKVIATPKPTVNPYDLPVCSGRAIALEIAAARRAVTAFSNAVGSFRSPAVDPALVTETGTALGALAGALDAWARCATAVQSKPYFVGGQCAVEVKRVDAARAAVATAARRWPEATTD